MVLRHHNELIVVGTPLVSLINNNTVTDTIVNVCYISGAGIQLWYACTNPRSMPNCCLFTLRSYFYQIIHCSIQRLLPFLQILVIIIKVV